MESIKCFESVINMGGGVTLPVRSSLVTLKNGHKILISPLRFNEEQLAYFNDHSPDSIVASNKFHHLFVERAAEELGVQTLLCAPGLENKRSDINWSAVIDSKTWPYSGELDMILIEGVPAINECVFFHRDSKTLIVTDLFFNFKNLKLSLKTFIYKLMGTFNRPACSRLVNILARDKKLLKKSLENMMNWDFETIIMAHGEVIHHDAKKIARSALQERGLID